MKTFEDAATYLEKCALILELRAVLQDPAFSWIHRAKMPDGKLACRFVWELIDRQPPASIHEIEHLLYRVLTYHLQNVGRY